MLNSDWLLNREAVDAAKAGEAGDASLRHSSSIWVAHDRGKGIEDNCERSGQCLLHSLCKFCGTGSS